MVALRLQVQTPPSAGRLSTLIRKSGRTGLIETNNIIIERTTNLGPIYKGRTLDTPMFQKYRHTPLYMDLISFERFFHYSQTFKTLVLEFNQNVTRRAF